MANRKNEMPAAIYDAKVEEVKKLQESIKELTVEMQVAREAGDLSENAEYTAARSSLANAQLRLSALEEELSNSIKVTSSKGPKIGIGDKVKVVAVDAAHNPVAEPRIFTVAHAGDTVLQKVLSINSSLGKVIRGGVSGYYTIPDNGGVSYYVEKLRE